MISTDFEISGDVPTAANMGKGKTKSCCNYGADGKGVAGYDCLLIPDLIKSTAASGVLAAYANCGYAGLVTMDNVAVTGTAATDAKTLCCKNEHRPLISQLKMS